jgi:hypothetical protein
LSKTYDGTKNVADSAYTWGSGVDEGEIFYAATEKNAGTRDVYAYSTQRGYDITLPETLATVSITPRSLGISGITASDKTYDGTTEAGVDTANAEYGNLVEDDDVSVSATGSFSDKNVGTDKTVTLSSEYAGADVANYDITDQEITTASILRRLVEVAADPKAKEEGRVDPVLTYQVEAQQGDRGLVAGETLNGSLTREAGEDPGIYEILQGNLHNANNPNYDIWYTPADFTITEADTGVPEPVQDAVSTSKQDISNRRKATNALVSRYRESVRNELWGDQSGQDGEGGSPDTGGGQRHWTLSLGEFLKLRVANRGIRFPEWINAE